MILCPDSKQNYHVDVSKRSNAMLENETLQEINNVIWTNNRNTTYIKEEALSSVHRRGVESITPVRSTAGWTTGSFAVVDAKIVWYVYV